MSYAFSFLTCYEFLIVVLYCIQALVSPSLFYYSMEEVDVFCLKENSGKHDGYRYFFRSYYHDFFISNYAHFISMLFLLSSGSELI